MSAARGRCSGRVLRGSPGTVRLRDGLEAHVGRTGSGPAYARIAKSLRVSSGQKGSPGHAIRTACRRRGALGPAHADGDADGMPPRAPRRFDGDGRRRGSSPAFGASIPSRKDESDFQLLWRLLGLLPSRGESADSVRFDPAAGGSLHRARDTVWPCTCAGSMKTGSGISARDRLGRETSEFLVRTALT